MTTAGTSDEKPRVPTEGTDPPQPTRGEDEILTHASPWVTFIIGATLVVAILYIGRDILIPLTIAILLSFLLSPLVTRLRRLRVPRVVAVLLTVAFAFLIIGALALLLGVQAIQLATELPSYQSNLVAKLQTVQNAAPSGGVLDQLSQMVQTLRAEATQPDVDTSAPEVPVVQVQEPPMSAFDVISQLAAPLLGPIGKAGIVIVLVIFMLLEREDLRNRLIRLLGPNMNLTTEVMDEAGTRVSRYLLMQLVVNVTYGIPFGVGLYFIGIPNAFLWAALAVMLRFIPYLGPLLSATFPLLLAVAVDPGWTTLVLTLGLILTLELISNNFIEPWLYGASTSMSAVAVIFAAIFWTALWGPAGLLLATPLTVCLAVAGRYFPQLAFLDVLLGRAPALSLPERLYQRLLAGDVEESLVIAENYVADHSFLQLYDDVVIPALRMAAEDDARHGMTPERRHLVMRTVLKLISELADLDAPSARAVMENARDGPARGSVLCAAGRSALDVAAAAMLGQLLERRGFATRILSVDALSPEHLPAAGLESANMVCLSYLDPDVSVRIKQMVRRLTRQAPQLSVLVGMWHSPEQSSGRLDPLADYVSIVTTLGQALQGVEAIATPSQEYAPAPIPPDEAERLADLRRLRALETSNERLERYTWRLSRAFDVPIALFNLIDEDSQRFGGQVGLPEDLARAGSSPRDTSICGHVVAENDLMIIEDVLKDPRFAKNPFLLEHGIRFYAGVPLRSRNGHAIGSLCVIDASPRTVTEEQQKLLHAVAAEAMAELEKEAAAAETSPSVSSNAGS